MGGLTGAKGTIQVQQTCPYHTYPSVVPLGPRCVYCIRPFPNIQSPCRKCFFRLQSSLTPGPGLRVHGLCWGQETQHKGVPMMWNSASLRDQRSLKDKRTSRVGLKAPTRNNAGLRHRSSTPWKQSELVAGLTHDMNTEHWLYLNHSVIIHPEERHFSRVCFIVRTLKHKSCHLDLGCSGTHIAWLFSVSGRWKQWKPRKQQSPFS